MNRNTLLLFKDALIVVLIFFVMLFLLVGLPCLLQFFIYKAIAIPFR